MNGAAPLFPPPAGARNAIRQGRWTGAAAGLAPGYAQANLLVVRRVLAEDFRAYCRANQAACPVMEELEPGGWEPLRAAPGADLRTDVPRYHVHRRGILVEERNDLLEVWSDDLVAFLLGCSFTFEAALSRASIRLPHLGTGRPVAMYRTTVQTVPVGTFHGPLVVSMRWVPEHRVQEVVEISARYPSPTALRSTSAIRMPWESSTWSAPTTARPGPAARARSPSSGRAASRRRPPPPPRGSSS